ncbi:MAG: ATP-binding protein [Candidatus Hodarchaeales archaeon]
MNCYFCGKIPYTTIGGHACCKECFVDKIRKRVRKTISKYKMLSRGDKIVLGLSGGKDSVVLTEMISNLSAKYNSEVIAVTIDEGIAGYRDTSLSFAEKITKDCNVEHIIVTVKEYYGLDFDEIVKRSTKLPCSLCGPIRRRILNSEARKINADVVLTSHNLDDEAQTIMLNWLRGDYKRLAQLTRTPVKEHPAFIKRSRPLCAVQEPEIVLYAHALGLQYHDVTCPYASTARRNSVRDYLSREEEKHPGVLSGIVKVHDKLKKDIEADSNGSGIASSVIICSECGEPAEKSPCRLCRDLAFLKS